jgi:hypothetical protein
MSNLLWQSCAMKLTTPVDSNRAETDEIIGFFGSAQLVRRSDGLYELTGGARKRKFARGWCRCFAPEIVFATAGNESAEGESSL